MLIEFRFRNFKCFRDEQTLSMIANNDNSHPENIVNSTSTSTFKPNLLKSVAIYGANASGKSKILEAIKFFDIFVSNSFQNKPNESISIDPFRFEEETIKSPSDFEVSFIQDFIRYQYGFSVDKRRVHKEWLYSWPQGRRALLFERTYDADKDTEIYKFGDLLKGEKERIKESTRANALFLTTAAYLNHKQLDKVHTWFLDGLHGWPTNDVPMEIVKEVLRQEKNKSAMISLLRAADIPIEYYEIVEENFPVPEDAPEEFKTLISTLSKINNDGEGLKKIRVTIFRKNAMGNLFGLDLDSNESEGTKRYFKLCAQILSSFENPGVIYCDELDASFHPSLTKAIIKLFHNPELNCNNVQLIFNTHDTSLLDVDLFRRDQVWFTEKKSNNSSELYSLAEFSPRKTELLAKGYLQGRYGAIPFIGDLANSLLKEDC